MSADPSNNCSVCIQVNGREYTRTVEPRVHLADFLRQELGLTGTHLGCEQGVCGMCTVLVDGEPVKSCLVLTPQADGREVRTVESLDQDGELSALQKAFHDKHALQCGFCTPAFLMVAQSLEGMPADTERGELREALAGVLCRCTGYKKIVDAVEEWLRAQEGASNG
jgi:aerobic-type carbon monoxide dehydrogenase small subunit (CoxS/CutS family)